MHKNTEICVKLCKNTEIIAIRYWSEFPEVGSPVLEPYSCINLSLVWSHQYVGADIHFPGPSSSGKVSFVTESSQCLVFSSEDPSLVMTYDSLLSVHSLWTVRLARVEVRRTW